MRVKLWLVTVLLFAWLSQLGAAGPVLAANANTRIIHTAGSGKAVSLTFDAELGPDFSAVILDILNYHGIKATFFIAGQWAAQNPKLVKRIAQEGHDLGNHTYSHPRLTELKPAAIAAELQASHLTITKLAAQPPLPLYRPPYGSYNQEVAAAAAGAGYPWTVLWNIDTEDWRGTPAPAITTHVLQQARPGSIILFHVTGRNTAQALPGIINGLRTGGFQLLPLSQLIPELAGPQPVPDLAAPVAVPPQPPADKASYTVKPGDTMSAIARLYGVSYLKLAATNQIANPNLIFPGQILTIF